MIDIVIYVGPLVDHITMLREVLEILRTHKLKLQLDKCGKEVNYFGHEITEDGVRPDSKNVTAIERFSQHTNAKQLKTFCGMISYYRRFIRNCSRIASSM
jgi:hypothetical protein